MAETANYKLYKDSSGQTNFLEWRERLAGETESNMDIIDTALNDHDAALKTHDSALSAISDSIANVSDDPDYDSFVGTYGIDMGGEESKQFAIHVPGANVSMEFHAGDSMQDIAASLNDSMHFMNFNLTAVFDKSSGHLVVKNAEGEVLPYRIGIGTTVPEGTELTPKDFTVKTALGHMLAEKQDKITGTQGQIVGFDAQGKAVAQDAPEEGITQEEADGRYLQLSGGTMTGFIKSEVSTKNKIDTVGLLWLETRSHSKSGAYSTMGFFPNVEGPIFDDATFEGLNGFFDAHNRVIIRGIENPRENGDAANKGYVDDSVAAITPSSIGAMPAIPGVAMSYDAETKTLMIKEAV